MKLSELVEVKSGYSFRGAIVDSGSGLRVLQAKNVSSGSIDYIGLPRINDQVPSDKLLQPGDILLTSRGSFRAAAYQGDGNSVASSSLFVLRPNTDSINPEFIAVYLNSSRAQAYLNQSAKGATIKSVRIDDLSTLEVPVPSLERQKQISDFDAAVQQLRKGLVEKTRIINELHNTTVSTALEGAK